MSRRPARTGRGRGSGRTKHQPEKPAKPTPAQARAAKDAKREYRARRRAVAPLVDFEIPLDPRPADKAKLTRYFKYLFGGREEPGITQGVRVKVRKKDPAKLEKLQRQLGQGRLRGVKYAFVPTVIDPETEEPMPVTVSTRKRAPDLIRIGGTVSVRFLPFDKSRMVGRGWRDEVERVFHELSAHAEPGHPIGFRIRNGTRALVQLDMTLEDLLARISELRTKYDPREGRETELWLDGLFMEEAGATRSLKAYQRAKQEERAKRTKIGKINVEWARLLKAIDRTGADAMTEVLSRAAYGVPDDLQAPAFLKAMSRAGLVTGDSTRWMMTRKGRAYLKNTESLLPIFRI